MARQKRKYIIFTFASTHDAMAMESLAKSACAPGRLIPLPGSVSAGCGLAWRVLPEEYELLTGTLSDFSFEATHEVYLY